jgi:hypothetical protein
MRVKTGGRVAMIAGVACLTMAACGGSSSSAGTSASSSTPATSSPSDSSASSSSSPQGRIELSHEPTFPAAVGDTFTLRSARVEVTVTYKSVTPISGGQQLALQVHAGDLADPTQSQSSVVPLNLYDDGRIGFPYTPFEAIGTHISVKQAGEILLPSSSTEGATLPSSSSLQFTMHAGDITGSLTSGATTAGIDHVTVPAGTFDARVVSVDVTLTRGNNPPRPTTMKIWFAPGVGIVRIEPGELSPSNAALELTSTVQAH